MATIVLVMGKSGSGKTASLRNFAKDELCYINVANKPLSFRGKFTSTIISDNYAEIKKDIKRTVKKSIVIDDSGMLITNMFMRNHVSAGKGNGVFALYNDLGDHFWNLIEFAKSLPEDRIVYFVMHENQNDFGSIAPKTIGKMLDDKVCIESLFTIVLRSIFVNGKYVFKTQTDGTDVTKSPMGLFAQLEIDNDLKIVDGKIRDYYGI